MLAVSGDLFTIVTEPAMGMRVISPTIEPTRDEPIEVFQTLLVVLLTSSKFPKNLWGSSP